MRRSLALWPALTAVYALAVLAGGEDAARPVPWALGRARDALGTLPVQLLGAAATALAFTVVAATARRVLGDPWATATALLVALSAPALACATRIGADPWAALCLAGGLALTARCRTEPRRGEVFAAAVLVAVLPWFGVWHGVAAVLLVAALVRWTLRRGRPVLALVCVEVLLASAVSLAEVGLPVGPDPAPGSGPLPLLAVLLDREGGVLRWAPFLLLAPVGAFAAWRSLRDGLARLVPERAEAEAVALLCAGAALATLATAAFAEARPLAALPVLVPLVAWGARRVRRTAWALGALTLAGSAWGAVEVAGGTARGWTGPGLDAPWGPLVAVFPRVADGGWWPVALLAALAAGLLGLVLAEWRAREAMLDAAATGR